MYHTVQMHNKALIILEVRKTFKMYLKIVKIKAAQFPGFFSYIHDSVFFHQTCFKPSASPYYLKEKLGTG